MLKLYESIIFKGIISIILNSLKLTAINSHMIMRSLNMAILKIFIMKMC